MSQKPKFDKVVVHSNGRLIKGYIESQQWEQLDGLLVQGHRQVPDVLQLRSAVDDTLTEVSVKDVKAVFFVKSFEGQGTRNDLKFFSNAPMVHGIWVQLQFKDGDHGRNRTEWNASLGRARFFRSPDRSGCE